MSTQSFVIWVIAIAIALAIAGNLERRARQRRRDADPHRSGEKFDDPGAD